MNGDWGAEIAHGDGKYLQTYFLKDFIYFIFRQKGKEGEREGEKHQCVVVSCAPPTGDLACSMCPDWGSNQQPLGLQAGTQSTEPHQPGLKPVFLKYYFVLVLRIQHNSYKITYFTKCSPWYFRYPSGTIHAYYIIAIFPMLNFTSLWLFCNYQFVLLNPFTFFTQSTRPLPLWQPSVCSLHLWVCFSFSKPILALVHFMTTGKLFSFSDGIW